MFLSLLCPGRVFADLYINEFSSGTTSDWVELYNPDISDADLSKYILRDSTSSDTNKIDLAGTIPGKGFAVFDWSNKLNNDGDTIRLLLKSDESVIIDQISYGNGGVIAAPQGTQTVGRDPDGSSNVVFLSVSSRGETNNSASPIPTATLTPTDLPTPTKEPTPTHTPTPTKQPTNTPTPKPATNTPTPKPSSNTATPTLKPIQNPSPSISENSSSSAEEILGESKENQQTQNSMPNTQKIKVLATSSVNWISIILILTGIVFLAACAIVFFYPYLGPYIIKLKKKFIHE